MFYVCVNFGLKIFPLNEEKLLNKLRIQIILPLDQRMLYVYTFAGSMMI